MKENLKILFLNHLRRPFKPRLFLEILSIIIALEILAFNVTINAQQASQKITVSGTVLDATSGEPFPAVNVVIQGTTTGTSTDASGRFMIVVPNEKTVLEFTFIGYVKQTLLVGKQR